MRALHVVVGCLNRGLRGLRGLRGEERSWLSESRIARIARRRGLAPGMNAISTRVNLEFLFFGCFYFL